MGAEGRSEEGRGDKEKEGSTTEVKCREEPRQGRRRENNHVVLDKPC